jgi:hypothetical protein
MAAFPSEAVGAHPQPSGAEHSIRLLPVTSAGEHNEQNPHERTERRVSH